MVRVTLDEIRLNAIFAALDERQQRLGRELARLTTQRPSPSREYAMDANAMALEHTYLARMELTAAIPEPELPDDMTFADLAAGDHYAGMPR